MINSLPENGLPPSLKKIHIKDCGGMLHDEIMAKKGANWDKLAAFPGVINVCSLFLIVTHAHKKHNKTV
jgi:hypothetical protein